MGSGAESQRQVWIQARRAAGLQASGDRSGDDAQRTSAGLRSDGRQHVGQVDAAEFSGQDRKPVWEGAADMADGSRHPDRGYFGGDADLAARDVLPGGNIAGEGQAV